MDGTTRLRPSCSAFRPTKEGIKHWIWTDSNKCLATYEIASHIYSIDNGKTLGECLAIAEANNADLLEEDADKESQLNPTLKKAFANTRQARGRENIKIGQNRTPIMNGKSVTKTSSFKDIADAPIRAFNKIANEDRGELPWIRSASQLQLSENAVKILKNAVARKQAIDKACREEFANRAVKNVKDRILQKHEIEEALTPAARTIVAKPLTGERSVKTQLPREFSDNPLSNIQVQKNVNDTTKATTTSFDLPAVRMNDYAETAKFLPDEWRPKLTASSDNSFKAQFGRMKNDTPAEATRERPVASTAGIDNPETNDQREVADKYYGAGKSRPKATTVQTKDKTNPKTCEGQWPSNPGDPYYPEETASSRSPGSRW